MQKQQQPAIIVKKKGQGVLHKYYTQTCRDCKSDLEISCLSLNKQWITNADDKKREQHDFFYCPVCDQWRLFCWNCREILKSDKELSTIGGGKKQ